MYNVHLASLKINRVIFINIFSLLWRRKRICWFVVIIHIIFLLILETTLFMRSRHFIFIKHSNESTQQLNLMMSFRTVPARSSFIPVAILRSTLCCILTIEQSRSIDSLLHTMNGIIMRKHEDIAFHLNCTNCNQFNRIALHKWAKTLTKLTFCPKKLKCVQGAYCV